jgi:HAD superfamily hydrolase (TIGR01490 family)
MKNNKFAVFDIDGTIFRSSLVLEAVHVLIRKGVFPDNARAGFETELEAWRSRKDTDAYNAYIEAVVAVFGRHITGVSEKTFKLVSQAVVAEQQNYTYVYTTKLARELKNEGYTLVTISGSPKELVEPFTQTHGFDITLSTIYDLQDGVYTGTRTAMHKGKDKLLTQIVKDNGLTFKGSIGVGDTRGDISMLSVVDNPIAFNPDQELYDAAKRHGWKIVVERKNVIYEL